MGLAQAAVKTADAAATATHGDAEAKVIEARFEAESKGLKQKFEAMAAMSGETRAHEEFRMQLEISNQQINKGIDAQTLIAKDQAEVLGKALQNAKIDIVGGEGDYFDRFVKALSIGKGIDATVEKSRTLQVGLKDHLSGERDMVGDVRGLLGALGSSSGELQNLTVSALLARISSEGTTAQQQALQQLLASFQLYLAGSASMICPACAGRRFAPVRIEGGLLRPPAAPIAAACGSSSSATATGAAPSRSWPRPTTRATSALPTAACGCVRPRGA
ncbi:hypothetical protein LP420_38945 [Massilia sp. B-10]|nr:hypothetical protein LP420_38945 [Massilia sp. B-10]